MLNSKWTMTALGVATISATTVAIAAPLMGTWLVSQQVLGDQNLASVWGAKNGTGWSSLPGGIVNMPAGSTRYPLCMPALSSSSAASAGWLGIATAKSTSSGEVRLKCEAYNLPESAGGTVFKPAANRPPPQWMGKNSSSPEPFGAIALFTQQTTRRPVYACSFPLSGFPAFGYVGDDGKCYGASSNGSNQASDAYQILVTGTSASELETRYGWVPGGPGYIPHGTLASMTQPNWVSGGTPVIHANPIKRTVCRVQDTGTWWPGYLAGSACEYYTYFNNSTQKKLGSNYDVFRMGPGAMRTNYSFGSYGGKSFYACVAAHGQAKDKVIWGFSSNTQQCTDGQYTGGTNNAVLGLPLVNATRG